MKTFRIIAIFFCICFVPSLSFAACTATGTSPSVTICAPTSASVTPTFHLSAATLDTATVTAMKIYIDGVSVYQTAANAIETDVTVAVGNHNMTVKAWDNAGHVFSKSMSISASATSSGPCPLSATDPSVTICTPANGATVTPEFEVVAGTTDSADSITVMKIYIDGVSEYTFHDSHIDTDVIVSTGTHRVTVKAWDSANRIFSSTINITAANSTGGGGGSGPCAPGKTDNSVTICAPANAATVTSPVAVSAAATSSVGVSSMKVYLDGVGGYTVNASTLNTSVNASAGTHKITVKAWNRSNISFSSSVNFTVGTTTGSNPGPISPRQVALTYGEKQQFTSAGATSWSVDGVAGGNSATGTVDPNGLYTAPVATGAHTVTATGTQTASATVYVQNVSNLLFHNDARRSGLNAQEIALNFTNVKQSTFGKLASYPVDGQIYGQPLYVPNLSLNGTVHNVVFVATEHDSVYAFDADGIATGPLWQMNFLNTAAGVTTIPAADTGTTCCISPEVGITSTPVIDPSSNTIYVVAATKENGQYVHRLHALDITSGAERTGSPVVITAAVPGTAPEHDAAGFLHLDPLRHLQRAALLLANGRVYIAYGSFNDIKPYHGWLLAYDAATLQQVAVFNPTPNGFGGGIWHSGNGPSADSAGDVFVGTGNGTYDAASGGPDYSQSIVKLDASLHVLDYFTPNDWSAQNSVDRDLGSGGAILFPDEDSRLVNVNKSSNIYLLNPSSLGGLGPPGDTQIPQKLTNVIGLTRDAPAVFNDNMYVASLDDSIKAVRLSNGVFQTTPVAQTVVTFPYPGASPSVSANGTDNGIVWALRHSGGSAVLYAFRADNLGELYDSTQAGSRDSGPISVRFSTPAVVNGHVYVAGKDALAIYGLLP